MSTTRNFTGDDAIFLGDDTAIDFTIYADDDQTTIEDVTGWNIAFAVRKSDRTSTALIEKSTEDSPAGIVISGVFNATPATNTQKVTVTVNDTDSYDPESSPEVALSAGRYRYSLKRMDAGFETTLARGDFEFVQGAVR
jgi:hypothetical protein